MFQKICNYLSILSTVLVLGILTGSFFTYRHLNSKDFQKQMMDKILEGVTDMMPKVLDDSLPKMTGPSIPKELPKL